MRSSLLGVVAIALLLGAADRLEAQSQKVVNGNTFTVVPFRADRQPKNHGDKACTFFRITRWNDPKGEAWIIFFHAVENQPGTAVTSESTLMKNAVFVPEDIQSPIVDIERDQDRNISWTIHIRDAERTGSEAECLKGVPPK